MTVLCMEWCSRVGRSCEDIFEGLLIDYGQSDVTIQIKRFKSLNELNYWYNWCFLRTKASILRRICAGKRMPWLCDHCLWRVKRLRIGWSCKVQQLVDDIFLVLGSRVHYRKKRTYHFEKEVSLLQYNPHGPKSIRDGDHSTACQVQTQRGLPSEYCSWGTITCRKAIIVLPLRIKTHQRWHYGSWRIGTAGRNKHNEWAYQWCPPWMYGKDLHKGLSMLPTPQLRGCTNEWAFRCCATQIYEMYLWRISTICMIPYIQIPYIPSTQ